MNFQTTETKSSYLEQTMKFNSALKGRPDLVEKLRKTISAHFNEKSIEPNYRGEKRQFYSIGSIGLNGAAYPFGIKLGEHWPSPEEWGTFDKLYNFFNTLHNLSAEEQAQFLNFLNFKQPSMGYRRVKEIFGNINLDKIEALCHEGQITDWNVPKFISIATNGTHEETGIIMHDIGKNKQLPFDLHATKGENGAYYLVDFKLTPFDSREMAEIGNAYLDHMFNLTLNQEVEM